MNKTIIFIIAILFVAVVVYLSGVFEMKTVENGDTVSVHYTGKFPEGEIFDSSVGKDPLTFVAGAGQMIQGFDEAVLGMKVGDKKTVTLPPEKAYGTDGMHPMSGKTLIFDIELLKIS